MFRTRLISGIVLVAAALLTIIVGGPLLWFTLLVVSLIGMFELYRACGVHDTITSPLSITGYICAITYYIFLILGQEKYLLVSVTLALILSMGVFVFTWPRYRAEQTMTVSFGLVYVAVMLSFIYRTRIIPSGAYTVWLIFLCSWGCDTCAYCVGMLIGKHKMSPKLSPKKSIEGAVGGVIGAAGLGALYAWVCGRWLGAPGMPVAEYAIICTVGALISMVGDLGASAIKRNHDIKDYGHLIPGHGGILDRFDSVIFTAPMIWLLAQILL